ncbi:MAG: prepilin-type N-terminal cleavage/methylation domain-containing protein [Cellvibrionaceae bacterium]
MFPLHSSNLVYRPLRCNGFSLLELIAVLMITSVLALTVLPRFTFNDNHILLAKQQIIDGLRHSRELALARAQTNTDIRFIVSASTIDVRQDGVSVRLPNVTYPINLPSDITVSRGRGFIVFDQLGQSSTALIEVSNGERSETVTLTRGGYAY